MGVVYHDSGGGDLAGAGEWRDVMQTFLEILFIMGVGQIGSLLPEFICAIAGDYKFLKHRRFETILTGIAFYFIAAWYVWR